MTENILIHIVIVATVKMLEFTGINTFKNFIIKVQKLGGLYKDMPVYIRSF